jgi:DNA topoisomerase-1
MLTAQTLRAIGPATNKKEAEKNIVSAVDMTAKRLGNTRSVCRKYYIHPVLIEAYLDGSVLPPMPDRPWSKRKSTGPVLRQHETDVLEFIKARLKQKSKRASVPMRIVKSTTAESPEDADEPPPPPQELKPTGS